MCHDEIALQKQDLLNTTERLKQLDGLRTVAFLAVFLHHSIGAKLLWSGVDLFFVLSGFLITGILVRQINKPYYFASFYIKRFLRIFPAYYFVLAITFFFIDPKWEQYWYWYVFFVSNINDAFYGTGNSMLDPIWSLAIEEQFYLIWPFLLYLCGKNKMFVVCMFLCVFAPILRGVFTLTYDTFRPVYHLLPTRIDLLAAGSLLALYRYRSPDSFYRLSSYGPIISACAAAIFLFLSILIPEFRTSYNSMSFNVFGYSLICIFMVGIVWYLVPGRNNFLYKFLSNRILVFLGTISYMMYLCHQIVIDFVAKLSLGIWGTAIVSLALIIVWSSVSWYLLEKPLLKLKDNINFKTI